MGSFLLETRLKDLPPLPHPLPSFPTQSPPPPPPSLLTSNLENKISPSVLLIIVILAVIFFISGLLHLLVRYLIRASNRDPEDFDNVTALQGQLQQLFHLHDAGVDQSFIDTLPIFLYKAIIGLKDPFDCAVCLCEFEGDDKLRLLPKCSHAFHLECIDTWLLSHSTCPLCRRSLIPDFSSNNGYSPVVLVLQSGNESSRESVSERMGLNPQLGLPGEEDHWSSATDISQKAKEEASPEVLEEKVVPVKLGKYRNVDVSAGAGAGAGEGEGSGNSNSNNNLDERRCFSMGSFEYVMDESSLLQVAIKPPTRKPGTKNPGHRLTMSECDCHSSREGFKGFDPSRIDGLSSGRITSNPAARESFSISKIWLRSKEGKRVAEDVSRRAFSFRWPVHRGASEELKVKSGRGSTASEFEAAGWDKSGSELGFDAEAGRVLSRADEPPSFARRALLWISGRHHKVVNLA